MTSGSEAFAATPELLREKIIDIVAEQGVIDRALLKPEATLDDLGVQSIDVVMILNEIEEVFGIYVPIDQSLSQISNVGDLVDHVVGLITSPDAADPSAPQNCRQSIV